MEFTFLGTSAGTPTRSRNVTALALKHGGPKSWYLIDCGEGTQHQLLRTRYSLVQLQAIFITHVHGDHSFGLPGLLTSASMAGRTAPLPIIAPRPVRAFLEAALTNSDSTLSYELQFIDSETSGFFWENNYIKVTTATLSHRVPCRAFVFTEKNLERQLLTDRLRAEGIPPGPAWGRLQRGDDVCLENGTLLLSRDYVTVNREPRRIVIAGDNDKPELLQDACKGGQVLIHEATYTQEVSDRIGPWPQHSSAAQVAQFAEAAGIPNLVLTHFSSRYQFRHPSSPVIADIENEARRFYGGHLILARDFNSYRLDQNMTLQPITCQK